MIPADLEALYRRQLTIAEPYAGVIAEIAADLRTPQWALKDVVTRFAESSARKRRADRGNPQRCKADRPRRACENDGNGERTRSAGSFRDLPGVG